jgi:ATP-dependent RNA helicase DDX56/DBP9
MFSHAAVRDARREEIRLEMMHSEKLKSHFEDNPRDLTVLRHDQVLQPKRVQPHLKHVPIYLVPKALQAVAEPDAPRAKRSCSQPSTHSRRGRRGRTKARRHDPLTAFTIKPKKGRPRK